MAFTIEALGPIFVATQPTTSAAVTNQILAATTQNVEVVSIVFSNDNVTSQSSVTIENATGTQEYLDDVPFGGGNMLNHSTEAGSRPLLAGLRVTTTTGGASWAGMISYRKVR